MKTHSKGIIRLCPYVVNTDKGLAPNPFYGSCTLAVCTPIHMGINLEKGDWIIGNASAAHGHKLIYAMRVAVKLNFDDYFRDRRFERKKPIIDGTWRQQCGDNMYFRDGKGRWKQHPSRYHTEEDTIRKDLKYPYVYVSRHFCYFGENAIEFPKRFKQLAKQGRGCLCTHDPKVVDGFLDWLEKERKPGVHGKPRDRDEGKDSSCSPCAPRSKRTC
jgi:Nucleotide modification associated domain 2